MRGKRRRQMPAEYSLLLTATLCLLAFGAVMVFSASSTTQILGGGGDGAYYFKRTVLVAIAGLLLMRFLSVRGLKAVRAMTPLLLLASIGLLVIVLAPGIGQSANGAQRWIGSGGFFQVQPSELAKLALVLYAARLLATKPRIVRDLRTLMPFLLVVGGCCLLIVAEPDLGTAIIVAFSVGAVLVAGGAKIRQLALVAAVVGTVVLIVALAQPYMRDRLFGFLHPGADAAGTGFQAAQAKIAMGSGGLFGVGLGQGVQKAFYLPEAHTDMIAAVIGEEVGMLGISVLVGLYSLFGYAGFRTAQRTKSRYEKLLVAGLTCLVLGQAAINLFAVMGMAPLTGVPLPFVSYGNSSLIVMLASAGLILNVASRLPATSRAARPAADGPRLRVLEGGRAKAAGRSTAAARSAARQRRRAASGGNGGHSRGGHGRARRAGSRRSRRASGQRR